MSAPDAATLLPGYCQAGIAVFPLHTAPGGKCSCGWGSCPSPGKHPIFPNAHRRDDPARGTCKGECGRLGHGVHDGTTDIGQVAEWLARWPNANWGGEPPEGVVILDVDPRNGGHNTLSDLEHEFGELPETLTARTGSGGTHYWLSHSGPARGELVPQGGIDVKKQGGYVVLPPSVHACGGAYTWTTIAPTAPAPRWVQLKLDPPVTRWQAASVDDPADMAGLAKFVAESPEGERNRRLYWAACRAAESGLIELDESGRIDSPLIYAAESIGTPRAEAEATTRSALHAPPRRASA